MSPGSSSRLKKRFCPLAPKHKRLSLKKFLDPCLPRLGKDFLGDFVFEEFKLNA